MLLMIFVSAILCGFIFKKSKVASVYILLVNFIISSYKFDAADMIGYIRQYNQLSSGLLKISQLKYPGYYILQSIFTHLGFSQQAYFNAFYIICLVLLYFAVKRLTDNVNIVLAVFTFYPFAIEAIQMKQFLADVLSFFALTYVFDVIKKKRSNPDMLFKFEPNKFKLLFGYILLIIASLIQFDAVFFLAVAVYITFVNREKIQRINIIMTVMASLLVYLGVIPRLVGVINRFVRIVDLDYISGFLTSKVGMGIVIPLFCIALFWIVIKLSQQEIVMFSHEGVFDSEIMDFISTVFFVIAMIGFGFVYFRLFRVYFIILVCLMANSKLYNRGLSFIKNFSFVLLTSILFIVEIYWYYDTTLGAMLHNNYLFH